MGTGIGMFILSCANYGKIAPHIGRLPNTIIMLCLLGSLYAHTSAVAKLTFEDSVPWYVAWHAVSASASALLMYYVLRPDTFRYGVSLEHFHFRGIEPNESQVIMRLGLMIGCILLLAIGMSWSELLRNET